MIQPAKVDVFRETAKLFDDKYKGRNGVWNLCAPDEAGNGGRYHFVYTSKGDLEYVPSELE